MKEALLGTLLVTEKAPLINRGKGKVHSRTGHESPEGSRGIALLFL